MSQNLTDFNRGVIKPVECLKEGWELIKDEYWVFLGICAVGMLIGSAFAIVLMGPMMCGVYLCFFQRMRGQRVSFDELFKGFDFFGQSVIATLIQMIPVLFFIVLAYLVMVVVMFASIPLAGSRGGGGVAFAGIFVAMFLFFIIIMLMSVALGVFFLFTFPLIVDRRLSGVDAVKTSVKAALANFGGIFGLVLLNALLTFGGALLCYIGAFFVFPVTFAAQAIAYRRVFPESAPDLPLPPPPPASWAA